MWTSSLHKGCYAWTFGQYSQKMSDIRPLFQALYYTGPLILASHSHNVPLTPKDPIKQFLL